MQVGLFLRLEIDAIRAPASPCLHLRRTSQLCME